MKIRLLDYKSAEHFVEIPDDTEYVDINIVTGDMVMTSPVVFDTSNTRMINIREGEFTVTKEMFHIFDEAEDTFDFVNKMYDWDDE